MSTPPFNPQPCCGSEVVTVPDEFTTTGLCLGDGTPIGIVNRRTGAGAVVQDGWINLLTGAFSSGTPPVGTKACGASLNIQTSDVLCDVTTATGHVNGLVLVQYHYNPDGSVASTSVINATTGAPYTPVGTITVCPTDTGVPDNDMQVLCDRQTDGSLIPFVRDYHRSVTGIISGFSDYTLGGAPYTVTGTAQSCVPRVSSSDVLCDSTGAKFLRSYVYGPTGSVQTFYDTTLAGVPFTPSGAVGPCDDVENGFGLLEQQLCDANGTAFFRRFLYNILTGAVTGTLDVALSGAPFTPVAPVGTCSTCCAVVVGEGCTNTGSGRYVAIRQTSGTILFFDQVTGASVTAGQIIPCPAQTVTVPVVTLTAQHRLVNDVDPAWTPASDVVGTLTSVTLTVLSGTANVVDQNATLASVPTGMTVTWSVLDGNTLDGPQVIDAIGGQTYVNWTAK